MERLNGAVQDCRENGDRPGGKPVKGWSWRQEWSIRASTMLLIFVVFVVICGLSDFVFRGVVRLMAGSPTFSGVSGLIWKNIY